MKQGSKYVCLISAGLWLVFQCIIFISEITSKNLIASPQETKNILFICIDQIPLIFFAGMISIMMIFKILNRKLRFEKIFTIICAILFIPKIIMTLVKIFNMQASGLNSFQLTVSYGMVVFENLILISIFLLLLSAIFNIITLKHFNVVLFSASCLIYIILTLIYISSMNMIISNIVATIIPTLLLLIIMAIAVLGIMMMSNNQSLECKS